MRLSDSEFPVARISQDEVGNGHAGQQGGFGKSNKNRPGRVRTGPVGIGVEMGGIEPPSEKQNLQLATLIVCL